MERHFYIDSLEDHGACKKHCPEENRRRKHPEHSLNQELGKEVKKEEQWKKRNNYTKLNMQKLALEEDVAKMMKQKQN